MCGIVGYIGSHDATSIILDGLQRLEYRGYDSAGVAIMNGGDIQIARDVGKLSNLRERIANNPLTGTTGIGHTRWATHGVPSEQNAHPHLSMNEDFVIVHNGIVENYLELKDELMAEGVEFRSETDTEVIVHLIQLHAQNGANNDLTESTRRAALQLRGAQAIVVMSKHARDEIVAVRIGNAGGVAIGIGKGENFIASDIPAILEHTRQMVFLENRQIATVTARGYTVQSLDGTPITPQIHDIPWNPVSAARGEYKHFMQKEIFEQPQSLTDTIRGRIDFEHGTITLPDLHLTPEYAQQLKRLVTVACGTSYYSGLVGKFFIERMARLHVEVDYGSEYRYRDPILDDNTAVLAITQSGETVDTLAAMEEAQEKGASLWSIVNAIGSQAMRIADGFITMNAGPEIGVASTKAFTSSIVDQYLLALYLAQLRNTLPEETRRQYARDIARLPDLAGRVLEQDSYIEELAQNFYEVSDFLFIGRGINYPIALEGALKLKEISYIHAEGYPAGEMKHGPIALIDEHLPVVAIAVKDALYEKMISQIEQAKARGGIVIAVATEGDDLIPSKADHVIYIPEAPEMLNPIIAVLPLQLLAYHVAVWRGADVDQPRNLAKSVTVE
ncbi:MAG: glutamine--fructose-6-phosphate transaminase (isomerizing) [Chloroflexi bacterium]|nr:MAG: glutamine--fructose-6-phosphate transaminase (isomerizing) [Phototrophicales bacterium]RMF79598.1 MAG: glutamine--fructose-6-phosphate transaminase (isomerizing) [Chloroflexota bacterium]